MKNIYSTLLMLAVFPGITFASSNINADIIWVGQRGNGNVIMHMSKLIDQDTCNSNTIEIPSTNLHSKGILSIAMAAFVSGSSVYVIADGCFNGVPTINSNGYIHMAPK